MSHSSQSASTLNIYQNFSFNKILFFQNYFVFCVFFFSYLKNVVILLISFFNFFSVFFNFLKKRFLNTFTKCSLEKYILKITFSKLLSQITKIKFQSTFPRLLDLHFQNSPLKKDILKIAPP